MSWNRPDPQSKNNRYRAGNSSRRKLGMPTLIILGSLAVLVAAAIWLIGSNDKEDAVLIASDCDQKKSAIATVESAKPTQAEPVTVVPQKKERELDKKIYVDEKGIERYPGGLRVQRKPAEHKINVAMKSRKKMIFHHLCENEIATLITLQPGELIFGPSMYGPRFVRDFKKSLTEEIKDEETDTPEEREVKQLVREVKKDLADRMAKGEDIGKIMADARAELQEAYQYRQTLAAELNKIKKDPSYTDKDVADFVAAANQMLESKGITIKKFRPGLRDGLKLKVNE